MRHPALAFLLLFFANTPRAQIIHSFSKITDTPDLNPTDIAIRPGGVLFVAESYGGLSACTFDGANFASVINLDDGANVVSVAAGSAGTVFSANNDEGLRALSYDGNAFTILDDMTHNVAAVLDFAQDVVEGPDGTLFLANYGDGLRAYTFDGAVFTPTAHRKDGLYATAIAVGADSTIFVGLGVEGLWAYTYDDTSFTNTASIDETRGYVSSIAIGADGTLFVANSEDGLRAYTYDDTSFTNTAHIDSGGSALDLAIDQAGVIYLANATDGIRAFTYDGSSFYNTAHLNTLTNHEGIAVDENGIIFADNTLNGMAAYEYTLGVPIEREPLYNEAHKNLELHFSNPARFTDVLSYTLYKQVEVRIALYAQNGRLVQTLVKDLRRAGTYVTSWQVSEQVSGVYLLKVTAGGERFTRKIVFGP